MANNSIRSVPGMADVSEPEASWLRELENAFVETCRCYGLEELRTPLVEFRDLFAKSLGDATDVVQKEMFSFTDAGERELALRPEGTAGVLRYVASERPATEDVRLFYVGPMFRRERPQAGRRRQFHQFGVEMICSPDPVADAECLALQVDTLRNMGLQKFGLKLNTRGQIEDIGRLQEGLRRDLQANLSALCPDCQRRFQSNVLRILDCKREECGRVVGALPRLENYLSEESRRYIARVYEILNGMGIRYEVEPRLVRGLDYYVHTVWEVVHPGLGAQDAVSGGGRYEVEVGGRRIQGVGFAIGVERLLLALKREQAAPQTERRTEVALAAVGEGARIENLKLAREIRARDIACLVGLRSQSLKAQLRAAQKAGCRLVLIRGEDELRRNVVRIKDLGSGEETECPATEAVLEVQRRLAEGGAGRS